MNVYVGDDAALPFLFVVDGEFVSPTAASYTVRDHLGAAMAGLSNVAIDLTGSPTQVVVPVLAAKNTVGDGMDFENRTVEVKFTFDAQVFTLRSSYRVTNWLNYVASADQVRAALGVMPHELPDADIDLQLSYFQLRDRVGNDVLVAALSAGDITNLNANNAIVYLTALGAVPTLQLRAAVSQQDDAHTFERLASLDFVMLAVQMADLYDAAAVDLVPVDARPAVRDITFMVVSAPTDPVTGA